MSTKHAIEQLTHRPPGALGRFRKKYSPESGGMRGHWALNRLVIAFSTSLSSLFVSALPQYVSRNIRDRTRILVLPVLS